MDFGAMDGGPRKPSFQRSAWLTAAASNRGVLRVEDAFGLLFLGGKLLTSRRPPRLPSLDPQALEHDFF
jgi:hypothetical protein